MNEKAIAMLEAVLLILDSDEMSNAWEPCRKPGSEDCGDHEDDDSFTPCRPCLHWREIQQCREALQALT